MRTNVAKTLTSANSILLIRAIGYNSNFVKAEGYAADNAFDFGDKSIGETMMGVDGVQSVAYTPSEADLNIQFQANSPTLDYLQGVVNSIEENQETYPFEFSVEIPSIKKRIHATGGLVGSPGGISAGKTLKPTTFSFKVVVKSMEDI